MTPRTSWAAAALWLAVGVTPAQATDWTACEHDPSVTERFLPVELINGLPLPEQRVLQLAPVDRSYPFTGVYPSGEPAMQGQTTLKGPVEFRTGDGRTVQAYERAVPQAKEVIAITFPDEAMGRVYDSRAGLMHEAKFPIGLWKQGETRHHTATYFAAGRTGQARTSITIEKLQCRYDGVDGAVAFRWKVDDGRRGDYGYVFAPGRGLVRVIVYRRAG
ncbi:hypothetical protein [Tepidimonas ignava]|uniref:hypothetical protein n=1 Tax=Tepidimonas ignava TaxID=114249 RepID=UPI002FD8880E